MLTLLSSALGARPASDAFPRLSDNTAGSATQEVRKVLHGNVDGMFVVPQTRQMVAAAGGYLWKFSEHGVLLDTLRPSGAMFTSGIAFEPDHFVDWVYTGSAQRKAYGDAVDGNAMSLAAVVAALQRADVVEFGKSDTAAWAYVWTNGQAHKMDLTRHRDQVDTSCNRRTHSAEALRWKSTCLDGMPRPSGAWKEVEPGSFSGYGDPQPRLEVVRFDRRRYHLEEGLGGQLVGATVGVALKAMGMPGSLPGRYWFGDAHTRLKVGGEVVQFKAFVPFERGDYLFMHNMRWWEPATALPGASPWFSVHMRSYMDHAGEVELLRHYEKDIGLYVVRPRGAAEVPPAQRTVPAWRPVFEGPATRYAAVTGTVQFAAAQPAALLTGSASAVPLAPPLPATHVWLRSPPPRPHPEGVPPAPVEPVRRALHQLPASLTVAWGAPSREDEHTVVRIDLPGAETLHALDRLQGSAPATKQTNAARGAGKGDTDIPEPIELAVRVVDLKAPLEQTQVLLRRGSREVPLPQARLIYVVQPAERPARAAASPPSPPVVSTQRQRQQLLAAQEAAIKNARASLPAFLQLAQALVQDMAIARPIAPHVTAAYADLVNRYNRMGDLASSAALVQHYLAQVHPYTSGLTGDASLAYNQGVIASQTLAFAIHQPEHRALVESVMATLIGPGFDLQQQTNGTLVYNLACYYAVQGDKPRLLQAVPVARRLGKPASQFLADKDFERFWEDAEFQQVLR